MTESPVGAAAAPPESCAQCSKTLTPDDRVASGDRVFCRSCYEGLRAELEAAVARMSEDIPWVNAAAGALLGGLAGTLLWWGFTAVSHIALGLLAVAIGFLTGWCTVRFSGGKRSGGLQALSITVAVLCFFLATYLVNMSFINQALAQQSMPNRVPFPPRDLVLFYRVVTANFGVMDLVFLAIVIYEAWKIPRPLRLQRTAA